MVFLGNSKTQCGKEVIDYVKKNGLENSVVVIDEVDQEALPLYYQHAKINIFASECENCPITLLEGLASGVPNLVSNVGPNPEFAKDFALYFDPAEPEQLANLFIKLDQKMIATNQLIQDLDSYMEEFNWKKSICRTWEEVLKI
ncbi:MAG: hypothetical protein OHK0038_28520 [Flammeovirgaceae bacterium]